MSGSFNLNEIKPRKLGKLNSNSSCNLYGWGGAPQYPRRQSVEVFHPSYCNTENPKLFCSTVASLNESSCVAYSGSPLICDEFESSFLGGFVPQTRSKCEEVGGKVLIELQSIGESLKWIERVSSGNHNQITIFLTLLSLLVTMRFNYDRNF